MFFGLENELKKFDLSSQFVLANAGIIAGPKKKKIMNAVRFYYGKVNSNNEG